MIFSQITLRNWRNFKNAKASLRDVTYVIGANATGKSNFLDAFRFLRDIAKPQGGGLQKAIADRGGLAKLRCLHARREPELVVEVELAEHADAQPEWKYRLAVKFEKAGKKRPIVAEEIVTHLEDGRYVELLHRPDEHDLQDKERLTQTHIEHVQTNAQFRPLVDHFAWTTYLHLVPQLLKYGDFIGGRQLDNDPFGQAFLARVAQATEAVRSSRLKRISNALDKVIPQFEEIRFEKDELGHPHLEAKYTHHRPNAGWQREDQFSDGTLRLIALFWLLMENDSLLLLEEPELSLDEEIVRQLPRLIANVRRSSKRKQRQIIITTHSQAMLENKGIDSKGILRLKPASEGTTIHQPSPEDLKLIKFGLTPAEVFLQKSHPKQADQLALW
jgi:predicted ATPase